MYVPDFNSNTIEEESTDLNYNLVDDATVEPVNPLVYYYSLDGRWTQQELPVEISRMRLGKNPYECEVKLLHPEADDVHIILQRTGSCWQIIECGKKALMHVNGLPKRQTVLEHKKQVIIHVGAMVIIFSSDTLKPKSDEESAVNDGDTSLEEGHYGFNLNGAMKKFPYKEPCLIGSDSICHVSVSGPQFAAMVTNVERKLFLSKMTHDPRATVSADGIELGDPAPLSPNSRININNQEIVFKLSKDLRFTRSQQEAEEESEHQYLQLLRLDWDGTPTTSYPLPKPASSITLGRSQLHAGICIENTTTLSRIHCQIITYENSIMLLDNESVNGCFVNGEMIKKSMVKLGDLVQLGDQNFILCYG